MAEDWEIEAANGLDLDEYDGYINTLVRYSDDSEEFYIILIDIVLGNYTINFYFEKAENNGVRDIHNIHFDAQLLDNNTGVSLVRTNDFGELNDVLIAHNIPRLNQELVFEYNIDESFEDPDDIEFNIATAAALIYPDFEYRETEYLRTFFFNFMRSLYAKLEHRENALLRMGNASALTEEGDYGGRRRRRRSRRRTSRRRRSSKRGRKTRR